MNTRWVCVIAVASSWFTSSADAQYNTKRGAVLGGLTGAVAGAAIGNHNGETAEGALIGSAVGLFSGALIGNSIDAEQSRQRYVQRQYSAQNARAVTVSQVLSMTQNGVSDAVIINHINQYGVRQRLEVSDVILLHQHGVREPVLAALQRAPIGGSTIHATPPHAYSAPVIVHDYHYVRPAYPVYAPHYQYRHEYPYHGDYYSPGVGFGFSVGH